MAVTPQNPGTAAGEVGARNGSRLFFALWPDDALREQLERMVCGHVRVGIGRRVPMANLHITLLFLGSVEEGLRPCIEQAGGAAQGVPFTLVLDRIGHWPRPRVLWAGPGHTPAEVFHLVGALRRGVESCGVRPDDRPFQAHMTLLRKVNRPPAGLAIDPVPWSVERFSLMASVPTEGGVAYRELRSWPLAAPSVT